MTQHHGYITATINADGQALLLDHVLSALHDATLVAGERGTAVDMLIGAAEHLDLLFKGVTTYQSDFAMVRLERVPFLPPWEVWVMDDADQALAIITRLDNLQDREFDRRQRELDAKFAKMRTPEVEG